MKNFRSLEMKSLLLVYGVLVASCLLIDYFSRGSFLYSWKTSKLPTLGGLIGGLVFIIIYLVATRLASRMFRWAYDLEKIFRQMLTPFSYLQIWILAAASGFVEEWFFRGLLLSYFGLMISSILFALSHFIPDPHLWIWGIVSFFVAIVLGLIYQASGSLLLVVIIHGIINGMILMRLNGEAHSSPSLPTFG